MSHNDTMIAMGPHPEDDHPSDTPVTDDRRREVEATRPTNSREIFEAWAHARCMERDWHRTLAARLKETASNAASWADVLRLLNEIDCRIEHGADSGGHLEYVRTKLHDIVATQVGL